MFECVADVQRRYSIDPARIVLQGFSMGGFGAWGPELQRPMRGNNGSFTEN